MPRINEERADSGIVHRCRYRIVWCPKYGKKVLVDGVDLRLHSIVVDIVSTSNSEVIELHIDPDRVQLAVQVDPRLGVHRLVKRIKRTSAGILRTEFKWLRSRLPTLWTNNYCVYTIGGAAPRAIEAFLENQRRRG